MNTRSTLQLTDLSITDLQLSPKGRKPVKFAPELPLKSSIISSSSIKEESTLSPTPSPSFPSNNTHLAAQSLSMMSESDDILAVEEIQRTQIHLENKFLNKIPVFKSPYESNVDEFLSQAEDIFNKLKYPDDIRLVKIGTKLDDTLQQWFLKFKQHGNITWNDFKSELPNCLKLSSSLLLTEPINDGKTHEFNAHPPNDPDDKPSLLDLLRQDIIPFSGDENARQWFIKIHSKFSDLNLSFHDRLEILPYFLVDEAIIWYSLNKNKIQNYTDFCQVFALEYFNLAQSPSRGVSVEQTTNNSINCLNDKPTSIISHTIAASDSNNTILSHSLLSVTIAKALIDRFIKDPLKFYGGKDNVFVWIEEIEQQFKIMNLNDLDKLNLIHICLKGEAQQWYKQYKTQFLSWSIFVNEIKKSFTSNLQRDLAFKKLKSFHQTTHQSVIQYHTEMIKLMQQADPQMNESTKVQYLMNGLRPSLSTETRRNYPKTTQDFLEQGKIAEELTALNNTFTSNITINDDLISPSSSYSTTNNLAPAAELKTYSRNSNADNDYYNNNYSSDDHNQQRYLNRISKSSSYNSHERNQSAYPPPQVHNVKSLSNYPPPLLNDNSYQNSNFKQQQQQQQQPFQRCFKCGSLDHIARQCHRFDKRGQ